MHKPVLIVGAGLAGLACARKLHRAGIPFLLFEADQRIGGRLKTDNVDGFLLDHGFQVHFTAYPYARRELDLESLELGEFAQGALVFDGQKLNLIDESKPLAVLRSRFLSLPDLWYLRQLASEMKGLTVQEIATMDDKPMLPMLRMHKISDQAIDRFIRPFFGGIFLDRNLDVSTRQFAFVWKMLAEGSAALPAKGIAALPEQIAAELPRYLIRPSSRVERVKIEHGKATGIVLDTGEEFDSSAVVVATEADQASLITGLNTVSGSKQCVTLYFEVPKPIVNGKYLVLNSKPDAMINEVAPLTNAQPGYAPPGKHLVSATILGERKESDERLVESAKGELAEMFPDGNVAMWRFIRLYRVRYAQFAQPGGVFRNLPGNTTDVEGLYFAGEFTTNSSIDGALQSGATCGNLLVRQFDLVPA